MPILRSADYKRMPWKNGKGETVEIAVFPPNASVNDFDWRISMATVAEDGLFSIFEGIDRTLTVLTGKGITLSVDGAEPIDLLSHSAPHSFSADVATSACLLDGQITDLNVMTRRGPYSHSVTRLALPCRLHPRDVPTAVLALDDLALTKGSQSVRLDKLDCAFFPDGIQQDVAITGASDCLLIQFENI